MGSFPAGSANCRWFVVQVLSNLIRVLHENHTIETLLVHALRRSTTTDGEPHCAPRDELAEEEDAGTMRIGVQHISGLMLFPFLIFVISGIGMLVNTYCKRRHNNPAWAVDLRTLDDESIGIINMILHRQKDMLAEIIFAADVMRAMRGLPKRAPSVAVGVDLEATLPAGLGGPGVWFNPSGGPIVAAGADPPAGKAGFFSKPAPATQPACRPRPGSPGAGALAAGGVSEDAVSPPQDALLLAATAGAAPGDGAAPTGAFFSAKRGPSEPGPAPFAATNGRPGDASSVPVAVEERKAATVWA